MLLNSSDNNKNHKRQAMNEAYRMICVQNVLSFKHVYILRLFIQLAKKDEKTHTNWMREVNALLSVEWFSVAWQKKNECF